MRFNIISNIKLLVMLSVIYWISACSKPENLHLSSDSKIATIESTQLTPRRTPELKEILSFQYAVQQSAHSVVNIFTTKMVQTSINPLLEHFFRDFYGEVPKEFSRERNHRSLGSGVIYRADQGFLYLITNNHVIEGADSIEVAFFDGLTVEAEFVGADPMADIAVIRVAFEALNNNQYQPIQLIEETEIGDIVLAIGNSFGVGQTVSQGIVSAIGRSNLGITLYEDFIQTDAAINPGNSGGALVNSNGELIGINTAIFSRSGGNNGIGFAIPSYRVRLSSEQLIAKGYVSYAWVGLMVQPLRDDLKEAWNIDGEMTGAVVSGLFEGSPALKAGIEIGDVLVGFQGNRIADASDIVNKITRLNVDDDIELTLIREGKRMVKKIKVTERPKEKSVS